MPQLRGTVKGTPLEGAPAILGGFDPGRVRSDYRLKVRDRTQLVAALARTEIPTVWV